MPKNKKRVREVFEWNIAADGSLVVLAHSPIHLDRKKFRPDDRVRVTVERLPRKKAKGE